MLTPFQENGHGLVNPWSFLASGEVCVVQWEAFAILRNRKHFSEFAIWESLPWLFFFLIWVHFLLLKYLFIFSTVPGLCCSMQLSSLTKDWTQAPLEAQSLSYWTTREVPGQLIHFQVIKAREGESETERMEEVCREETGLCESCVFLGHGLCSQVLLKSGKRMGVQKGCSSWDIRPQQP